MAEFKDDMFDPKAGAKKQKQKKPIEPTETVLKPTVKSANAEPQQAVSEDGVLKKIEDACGGNKYLESMILGEIILSPRFKGFKR